MVAHSYSETIGLVYSRNSFSFNDIYCSSWFARAILPSRLDLVRSVRIYLRLDNELYTDEKVLTKHLAQWLRLCHTLGGMKGLKELRIMFDGSHTVSSALFLRGLDLEGLRNIRNPTVFQVYLPWKDIVYLGEGPVPFQLFDIQQWPQL